MKNWIYKVIEAIVDKYRSFNQITKRFLSTFDIDEWTLLVVLVITYEVLWFIYWYITYWRNNWRSILLGYVDVIYYVLFWSSLIAIFDDAIQFLLWYFFGTFFLNSTYLAIVEIALDVVFGVINFRGGWVQFVLFFASLHIVKRYQDLSRKIRYSYEIDIEK